MKNEILPEGTRLITNKLTIASMCNDYFGEESMHSYWHDDKGAALIKLLGEEPIKVKGFDPSADWWDINVTTDNQALLSGVVMHNDYIIINGNYVLWDNYAQRNFSLHMSYEISKRHYPYANATLPVITAKDFDEVVLPDNKK